MKKLLFILIFIPSLCKASPGPLYQHKDPEEQRELQNIYQQMGQAFQNNGSISSGTIGNLTVSTLVVTGTATGNIGKVSQIVFGETGTSSSTIYTGFSDTGLSVTITPKSTSSSIFIVIMQSVGGVLTVAGNAVAVDIQLLRGPTVIMGPFTACYFTNIANSAEIDYLWSHVYTDTPGTISPVTYKTQFGRNASKSNAVTHSVQGQGTTSAIVAMEIFP